MENIGTQQILISIYFIDFQENCNFYDGHLQGGIAKQVENRSTEDACAKKAREQFPGSSGATWYPNHSCWAEFGDHIVFSTSQRTCLFQGSILVSRFTSKVAYY